MNNKVGKVLYICFGIGLVDALASMFLLGYMKGDHDRLKDLISKNDALKLYLEELSGLDLSSVEVNVDKYLDVI